jgi:hypothetical protein
VPPRPPCSGSGSAVAPNAARTSAESGIAVGIGRPYPHAGASVNRFGSRLLRHPIRGASLVNNTRYRIRVYDNDDYSGDSRCVDPGESVRNLKETGDFNDQIESAKTVSSC